MRRKINYSTSAIIGESETGLPAPICFDPHYPILENKPPVALITGSPGSGKTFLSLILAGQSSVMGKRTFAIDPKGDFLALKQLERRNLIGQTTVWSVFSNEDNNEVEKENYGMLDPLTLTKDKHDNVSITIDVIDSLVPDLNSVQKNALIPIVQDVADLPNPSLAKVVRQLRSNPDDDIRAIGIQMDNYSRMSVSKILIAEGEAENPFDKNSGTMVISLMGLDLPNAGKPEKDYSSGERIAAVIMRLITQLVLESMRKLPKKIRKSLFIDEAWIVFANAAGRSLIDQAALLGRSLNMATILATQSPSHLIPKGTDGGGASLDTTISTRFAFRNDSDDDNKLNRKSMRLPENEGWEEVFPKLDTGQCILKDCRNQLTMIRTMTNDEWAEAFNTNPSASLSKNKK